MIDPSVLLLLVVLGALAAAPGLLRRRRGATPDGVRVVGRTALHKNAVVAVVAVGDRRLLVGAGERGVQLLTELGDAPADQPADDRRDAIASAPTPTSTDAAPTALSFDAEVLVAGPGIGLVDRLRGMTVRTPLPGRPAHVPLRR